VATCKVATGAAPPITGLKDIVADFDYALDLLDRVDAFVGAKP